MKVYTLGHNTSPDFPAARFRSTEVVSRLPTKGSPGEAPGPGDDVIATESSRDVRKTATLVKDPDVVSDGGYDKLGKDGLGRESDQISLSPSNLSLSSCDVTDGSPHSLKVDGISYKVKVREGSWWRGGCCRQKQDKDILRHVSIHLKSSQLSGLMGNSGSGKTSLLDVISSRHSGEVEGAVYLDNVRLTESVFRRTASYVIQADRLLAHLTVKESLLYTAKLKFAAQLTNDALAIKVDNILQEMGLKHVANSHIGGTIDRGISGGERRRVSIAVQLLQDPYLLLLDEPTTGLDSFTAHYLVDTLATLARRRNKIILLSIHQPRSDIGHLFDNVGLLSEGRMVYFGPRDQLVPYFSRLGYQCPVYANPLDFYVDLSSIDRRTTAVEAQSRHRVDTLCQSYVDSDVYLLIAKEAAITGSQVSSDTRSKAETHDANPSGYSGLRFFSLVGILLSRMYLNLWRDRSGFMYRIIPVIYISGFIWIFCWQLTPDFRTGIQDRTGVFYQSTSTAVVTGTLTASALFPVLRDLYYREAREGLYGCSHLLVSYYVHVLPFHALSSILGSTWLYWAIGLYPDLHRFAVFFAVTFILQHLGEVQTLTCVSLAHNPALAQSVGTLLAALSCLYASGLFRAFENLIPPLQWFSYINFFRYAMEIIVANEYHDLNMTCPYVDPNCTISGDLYLDEFFPGAVDNIVRNFGILAAFVVGFWIITIVIFLIRGIRQLY